MRADSAGKGSGTVYFGGSHLIDLSTGTASIYYNPTSYANPKDFSLNVTAGTLMPYMLVNTLADLHSLSQNNSGDLWNKNYALGRNIDASGTNTNPLYNNGGLGFSPIGNTGMAFTGTLDGDNHVISGLYIHRPLADEIGLFGNVSSALIQNIGMVGGDFTGKNKVGALVGTSADSRISNSYNTGSVTSQGSFAGGLVGDNTSSTLGIITNSYNTGTITANSYAGGLVGNGSAIHISNSYNTGLVTSHGDFAGGIAGQDWNNSIIENCLNTGSVIGDGSLIGGIAGNNHKTSKIINSSNLGFVKGVNYIGGIAGNNNFNSTISYSYNAGSVSGTSYVGGLVGALWSGSVTDSYWDQENSGNASSMGSVSTYGKTTSQMMTQGIFSGWDFLNTWGIIEGVSYPYLKSQFTTPPQIISGKVSVAGAGKNIQVVVDGGKLASTTTGVTGFYYFVLPRGAAANNSSVLTYITGDATKSNAVYRSVGGNITNLDLTADTLTLGSGGSNATNATLQNGKGNITAGVGELFYDVVGNDLIISGGMKLTTDADLVSANGRITLGDVATGSHKLTVAAKDITLNGNITSMATGNGVILAASDTLVDNGRISISNPMLGRWLAYVSNESSLTGTNLVHDYTFAQYGTTYNSGSGLIAYNGSTIQGSGNGLVYTAPLTFTQSLIGSVSKVYDGTTSINNLSPANYQLSNVTGFTAMIDHIPTTGTYATKDVGSGIVITADPVVIMSVKDNIHNKPVFGYTITNISSNSGIINPKSISVQENGVLSKDNNIDTMANKSIYHNKGNNAPSATSLIEIINQGVTIDSKTQEQGLIIMRTTSGKVVTIVSVIINMPSGGKISDEVSPIRQIDVTNNQMIVNKELSDGLRVDFNGKIGDSKGVGLVSYDGVNFSIRGINPKITVTKGNEISETIMPQQSFSLLFDNGEMDIYQVDFSNNKVGIINGNQNKEHISRITIDINKLIISIGLKIAKDIMKISPEDIDGVIWSI